MSFVAPSLTDPFHSLVRRLSDYTFVGLIVLLVVVYSDSMVSLVGTGTLGLSAVPVGASLLRGFGFGGQHEQPRRCWRRRLPPEMLLKPTVYTLCRSVRFP
jgi:hypothetical protein